MIRPPYRPHSMDSPDSPGEKMIDGFKETAFSISLFVILILENSDIRSLSGSIFLGKSILFIIKVKKIH